MTKGPLSFANYPSMTHSFSCTLENNLGLNFFEEK